MKKKIGLTKIIGFGLIGIFVFLLAICIISHVATYKYSIEGLVNCILMAVACGILSLIFGLIFRVFSKPSKEPQQEDSDEVKKIKEEMKEIDAKSEKLLSGYNLKELKKEVKTYKVKKEKPLKPYEEKILEASRERLTIREKLKNIAIGFFIFVVCGAGYIPLTIFASNSIEKINSPEYVKVEAVVRRINNNSIDENGSVLVYSYIAEDGLIYTSSDGASFGGAMFKEGKKVTIYYNANNPKNIKTSSEIVMMFMGASFFFFIGLAVFVNFCWNNDGTLILLAICLTFIIFPIGFITAIEVSSGLAFFELLGCGSLVYILLCFGTIGLTLMSYFIYYIIHKARLIAKYKYKIWGILYEKRS